VVPFFPISVPQFPASAVEGSVLSRRNSDTPEWVFSAQEMRIHILVLAGAAGRIAAEH
jgi:hypothetical protein